MARCACGANPNPNPNPNQRTVPSKLEVTMASAEASTETIGPVWPTIVRTHRPRDPSLRSHCRRSASKPPESARCCVGAWSSHSPRMPCECPSRVCVTCSADTGAPYLLVRTSVTTYYCVLVAVSYTHLTLPTIYSV